MIKTVSLDTAKLLKEARFPQMCQYGEPVTKKGVHEVFDKPTTDELLEELPYAININKGPFEYRVSYHIVARVDNINFLDKSLPEALAQMWLFLKKENLL